MPDEPANLVLDLLRAIRGDVAELKADMVEVKERLGLLEQQGASISRRLDRVAGDVERIKRRLDLVESS
jgi:predicted nuclease with TOPRIM domain